jgi:hypothetical protein
VTRHCPHLVGDVSQARRDRCIVYAVGDPIGRVGQCQQFEIIFVLIWLHGLSPSSANIYEIIQPLALIWINPSAN